MFRYAGAVALFGFVFPAGSAGLFAQEPPTEWTFSLGARESGEFSRTTDGVAQDDRVMDAVNASLGLSTRTDYDRFGLFGRVGANLHREEESDDRRQLNFGAGLSWDRRLSDRNRSILSLAIDQGYRAETLSSVGLLIPGADTFATTASWNFQRRASPHTSLATSLRYNYVRLESDEPIPGSQIVLGRSPFRDEFPPTPQPSDDVSFVVPDAEDTVLDILATEGLSTLKTNSHMTSASFGLQHELGPYSSMGLDFAAGYQTFEDDTHRLREGAQGGFRIWAQRRIEQSSALGAQYRVTRSLVLEPSTTVHSLSGSYEYTREGGRISLELSAGASYYQAESAVSQLTPTVSTTLSAGLTRSTRLSALYRRQFSQALGFGQTLLIDYANLSLTQSFGPRVDLIFLGGASFGSDPQIESSRYDAVQGGATLVWRISDSLSAGTTILVLQREQSFGDGLSKARFKQWSAFITYTTRWR